MMGHDARYIPGWDCHGLPIEWKIEETYRKKGKNKDDVFIVNFRQSVENLQMVGSASKKNLNGWV